MGTKYELYLKIIVIVYVTIILIIYVCNLPLDVPAWEMLLLGQSASKNQVDILMKVHF